MKNLLHEQEISLGMEEKMDFLGFPSPLGSPTIDPFGTPLNALRMLIASPSPTAIVVSNTNMVDLFAAVVPLVQYDMFSWREDNFFAQLGKGPTYAHT